MEHGVAALAQGLITVWTLVAFAVVALAVQVYLAIHKRHVNPERAIGAFRSLDLEAFKNLVDTDEEAFLRQNLPPKKFRAIKRQRAWAAFIYAWEAGSAAAALAKVGQAARRSSDPQVAASGAQLSENAFRLRLQTMHACFRLLTDILLPGLQPHALPPLVDQYERASQTLLRLGRLSPERHMAAR